MCKQRAKIVTTKSGKKGFVYNNDLVIEDKVKVHVIDEKFILTGEKLLCTPSNLKVVGFKD